MPVLFGHPASIAHGLNLQESGYHLIMFSMTWNLEYYEQLYQRLWRQGQKNTVYIIHLIAEGTIDEAMLKAVNAKDKTQRAMLDALQAHYNFTTPLTKKGTKMEKSTSKFSQQKEGASNDELENATTTHDTKKPVKKKKVAAKKKVVKKKAKVKKSSPKKQSAKKKAVSNKGAVNDEKKVTKLTKLLSRKKGCGSAEAMDKLGVSRVTALKMIGNTKAKKIAHGVFKIGK